MPQTLFLNPTASRDWAPAHDAILNDAALEAARAAISRWPGYQPTPLLSLDAGALGIAALHYKDEAPRFGLGSFKALGGAYAVARVLQGHLAQALGRDVTMDEVTGRAHPDLAAQLTVACATDGNHGRSVAWGAQNFGCGCVIFIHATVSEGRKTAIEAYGAEVRRCDGNYDDSVREAEGTAKAQGWVVVSDTSYPGYMTIPRDVMQGYELMAAEAFDALDSPPTHIFLQTGVGGMAAAVAALAARRWGAARPVIVLCDPDQAACWDLSLRAGQPVAVTGDLDTLMAGLACGEVSALAWEILKTHADGVMVLPDDSAVAEMRNLADQGIVAGESAVAGLAGLRAAMADPATREALKLGPSSHVLVFGTEGDTDPELYCDLVGRDSDAVRSARV